MMAAPRQPKVGGLRLAGGQSSLESFVTRRIGGLPGDGVPVVRALQAAGNRVLDRREAGPGVENSTGVEFAEHAVARSSAATSVGGARAHWERPARGLCQGWFCRLCLRR